MFTVVTCKGNYFCFCSWRRICGMEMEQQRFMFSSIWVQVFRVVAAAVLFSQLCLSRFSSIQLLSYLVAAKMLRPWRWTGLSFCLNCLRLEGYGCWWMLQHTRHFWNSRLLYWSIIGWLHSPWEHAQNCVFQLKEKTSITWVSEAVSTFNIPVKPSA